MEIYLAASWVRAKTMRDVTDHLMAIGHTVTSTWILSEELAGMGPEQIVRRPGVAREGASRDLYDINRADRVAVFTDTPSSTGGYHVEFGYAMAMEKPVDIIGPCPNVFYALDRGIIRHFDDARAWFDQLHKDKG